MSFVFIFRPVLILLLCLFPRLMVISFFVLGGCAAQKPAPVVDRQRPLRLVHNIAPVNIQVAAPGYYIVRKGDTLQGIALDHGHDYKEIAVWNNIGNINLIRVGQQLRIAPPDNNTVEIKAVAVQPAVISTPQVSVHVQPKEAAVISTGAWAWPAKGKIINVFVEGANKGIDITGNIGDPISASAAGKVVYAGEGLRGYGKLIIIKHDAMYLSAYAHNSQILVKEGQAVKQGQKIAELGKSDSDQAKLHFEIRQQGKPVDPTKYLPER